MTAQRPTLAVFKLASCDGCQLTILDCERELLAIAERIEIAYFLEARTRTLDGPYDIGLVEGSITTEHDAERIRQIRSQCKTLITIGACATAGGIQSLRNWADVDDFIRQVYASPQYIRTLATSTPVSDHVPVDFELRGCPIDKKQLLMLIVDLLAGKQPRLPRYSVCLECKLRHTVCVAVARGVACLGPVTQAGCDAICPAYARECFGCHGPKESANPVSLAEQYRAQPYDSRPLVHLLSNFNAAAPEFRQTVVRLQSAPSGPTQGAD